MYGLNIVTASLASLFITQVHAYEWPSPRYDALETLLYEGRRYDNSNLASTQHPCKNRGSTNASIGAEWLRLAYHDTATHDSETGTGGLDASIAFELDKPGNSGEGLVRSLDDFAGFSSKYISRADVIAIGATLAVASCGGPILRFRGGRIDASSADGLNVPLPDEDLATHTAIFKRQGFSPEEMISLVACGHTMGGVRSNDRPDIIPPGPDPTVEIFSLFDSTTKFDNTVVTEYLAGNSQDPLVTVSNVTLASDLRIFNSDNNVTMQKLASPETFSATCGSLLERMLEVVPAGVNLTDITLLPAKVSATQLTIERQQLVFKTTFRLAEMINSTVSAKRVVTLLWCDKNGKSQGCSDGHAKSALPASRRIDDPSISPVTMRLGYYFMHYSFVVPIDQDESISTFWFSVDEGDGTQPTSYNSTGKGYPIQQDNVLYVPSMGSSTLNGTATAAARSYKLVSGVKSSLSPSRVYMSVFDSAMPNYGPPLNEDIEMVLDTSLPPLAGYAFYSAQAYDLGAQLTVDTHAIVDGITYTEDYQQTYYLGTKIPSLNIPPTAVTTVDVSPTTTTKASGASKRSIITRMDIGLGLLTLYLGLSPSNMQGGFV